MAVSHAKSETVADWTGTVTVFGSNTATNTIAATDLVRPTDWNSAHNQFYTLTGNTTNASTASGTNVVYSAAGPSLSIGGSTNTIVFSSPPHNSFFKNFVDGAYTTATISGNTSHAFPFNLPEPGSFSFIRIPVSMTSGASTTLATTAASLSASVQMTSTWNAVVYSIGTGASSRSLISVASGSCSWLARNSISVVAAGTQWSLTQGLTFNVEGNSVSTTTGYSASTTNYSISNTIFTDYTGGRFLDIPFANSLSAGPYWIVFGNSTSSSANSTGISTASAMFPRYSNHYWLTQIDSAFGIMGSTNRSSGVMIGAGASFSTAGGGTTSAFPISALSSIASQPVFPLQMIRSA